MLPPAARQAEVEARQDVLRRRRLAATQRCRDSQKQLQLSVAASSGAQGEDMKLSARASPRSLVPGLRPDLAVLLWPLSGRPLLMIRLNRARKGKAGWVQDYSFLWDQRL